MKGRRPVTNATNVNPLKALESYAALEDEFIDLVRSAASGNAEALERLLLRAQEVAWRFSTSVCGRG